MPRLLIISNPRASGGRRAALLTEVIDRLRAHGAEVDICETAAAGDAARFVRTAPEKSIDRIVIAGGDGTINDAIQGAEAHSVPCAILPTGTANVLAHELGLSPSAKALADYVLHGRARPVYAGRVNDRRFLSVASAGSDAQAVADLPRAAKKRFGKLAYVIFGMRSFARHGCPPFSVRVDEIEHDVSVVIANRGTRYGGNHVLAAQARMSDPNLVVTLFPPAGRVRTFLRLVMIALGGAKHSKHLSQVTFQRLEISRPVGAPIQGDGDIIGALPAVISVDAQPIHLVTPV